MTFWQCAGVAYLLVGLGFWASLLPIALRGPRHCAGWVRAFVLAALWPVILCYATWVSVVEIVRGIDGGEKGP